MKPCSFFGWSVVLAVLSWGGDCGAQSLGGGSAAALKENLDLPFDAGADAVAGEEAPEVLVFYGSQFEGDAFVFVVDRSRSMQDSGELKRAKEEIQRNVAELAADTQFALVFFDADVLEFPASGRLTHASPETKSAARAWLDSVPGGSGSCVCKGLVAAIRTVNLSPSQRKVIVYVGDGGGTCSGGFQERSYLAHTLEVVTKENFERAEINTIGVLVNTGNSIQEAFLKNLAAANGGRYRRISVAPASGGCS
jgi:hypothetical protein